MFIVSFDFSKNMSCPENKIDYKEHNDRNASMPEETQDEVEYSRNDMGEETKEHE